MSGRTTKAPKGEKMTKKQIEAFKEKRRQELLAGMEPGELFLLRNEIEVKDRQVESLNMRIRDLVHENDELTKRVAQLEWDKNIVVTGNEKKQEADSQTIAQLRAEKRESERVHAKEKADISEQFQQQMLQMDAELEEAKKEIEERNEERKAIEQWRKRRDAMATELQELRKQLTEERRHHKEEVLDLRRQQQLQRQQWNEETQRAVAAERKLAMEKAEEDQDKTVREIIHINKTVQDEAKSNEQRASVLAKQNQTLLAKNEELTRDLDLHMQMQEQHAKKSHRQAKSIRELNRKVASLEAALSTVVKEFDKERQALLAQTVKEIGDKSGEAQGLRKLLNLKNKELKQVKALAQTILDSRTEMETFFHDSLDAVKRERRAALVAARAQEKHAFNKAMQEGLQSGRFPAIRSASPIVATTSAVAGHVNAQRVVKEVSKNRRKEEPFPDKTFITGGTSADDDDDAYSMASHMSKVDVDVTQLTWEEREKVLRLLFTKMREADGRAVAAAPSSLDALGPVGPSWETVEPPSADAWYSDDDSSLR